jgi:RND family efflux transporter MFP subunit
MKKKALTKMKALMKKRISKIVLTVVLCGVTAFFVTSAFKSGSAPVPEYQVATVQRGDLAIDISASGNLALSVTEDLAFEISGTVDEILVEEGDSVKEGQLLVKLDTSEWDQELISLQADFLQAQINLQNAEIALDKAEEDDTVTQDEIDIKKIQVKLAKLHLENAREALTESLEVSPEIVAPFDGFITQVNVSGGDEVKKGTVAVTLADPNKFEAEILVSEMDIAQVEVGGNATVQVDAVQGLSLPAKVTHIAPTATIQSGVVNYKVKVEVESLESVMQERQEAMQQAMEEISSTELSERIKQAIEEGLITQEQAAEMMELRQQAQGGQQGQVSTTIPENFQLREGLTATVSLIVQQKSDVLLVPNSAITTQGRQTYVQVLSPDGTIEQRAITTGITDYVNTEVTEGLSEGEKVVIPQGTTTTTTTTSQPGRQGFFFAGPGG